jgi:hypothetical protein
MNPEKTVNDIIEEGFQIIKEKMIITPNRKRKFVIFK